MSLRIEENEEYVQGFLNEKLMIEHCKHRHKKIVPKESTSQVLCARCGKLLDEFKGGLFLN